METADQPVPAAKRSPFQFSLSSLIIATVIAGVLVGICVLVLQAIGQYKQRRYEEYAFRNVVYSITTYVDANQGAWPGRWSDLKELDPEYSRRLVGVNFDTDPRKLVENEWRLATVIFLKSGHPTPDDKSLSELRSTLSKHLRTEEKK